MPQIPPTTWVLQTPDGPRNLHEARPEGRARGGVVVVLAALHRKLAERQA